MSDPGRGVCAAPTADRTVTGKVVAAVDVKAVVMQGVPALVGVRRPRRRYEGPMGP